MNTVAYTILAEEGPAEVQAQPATPGLYVYQLPDTVSVGAPCRWSLGHHSGLYIARFSDPEQAHACAAELADWTDWTRDAKSIRDQMLGANRDDDAMSRYWRAIKDAGGHLGQCDYHGCT